MEKNITTCALMILAGALALFGASCASSPGKADRTSPHEEVEASGSGEHAKNATEEEKISLALFREILDIVHSTDDRQKVLPDIISQYQKIIREHPDVPLAQESYWKLITIYLDDYSPPDYEEAERLYREFLVKYPDSFFKNIIEDTLAKSYYKNEKWTRLLSLTAPVYHEYQETNNRSRGPFLFMYAEAQYNLGNREEAEKVYRTVMEVYPGTTMGMKSREMLEKLALD